MEKPLGLINSPIKDIKKANDDSECQAAIEPLFRLLVKEAKEAGWDELQIAFSLLRLAEPLIYGEQAD